MHRLKVKEMRPGRYVLAQSIATGLAAGAAVAVMTYVIAKHQATERQRQIAEERARRAYAQMSPERKSELKERKTRYIAVDTERDEHTSPQAKKSVMIWDTQSKQVVGNDVYDLQSSPAVGSTAKFDTYSAEYVGSGAESRESACSSRLISYRDHSTRTCAS